MTSISWKLSSRDLLVLDDDQDWEDARVRVEIRLDARCLARSFGRPVRIGRRTISHPNLIQVLETVAPPSDGMPS
jgi:hypothetical protein